MIQRIQSLWFLLASACAFLSLKMPFYKSPVSEGIASYQLNGVSNVYLMLLTIVIGTLAFVTIFLFKKRKKQVRFSIFCILLELLLILIYSLQARSVIDGTYELTALLQGCVLFFFFLALRGIGKDIKVIKDSDRLR